MRNRRNTEIVVPRKIKKDPALVVQRGSLMDKRVKQAIEYKPLLGSGNFFKTPCAGGAPYFILAETRYVLSDAVLFCI